MGAGRVFGSGMVSWAGLGRLLVGVVRRRGGCLGDRARRGRARRRSKSPPLPSPSQGASASRSVGRDGGDTSLSEKQLFRLGGGEGLAVFGWWPTARSARPEPLTTLPTIGCRCACHSTKPGSTPRAGPRRPWSRRRACRARSLGRRHVVASSSGNGTAAMPVRSWSYTRLRSTTLLIAPARRMPLPWASRATSIAGAVEVVVVVDDVADDRVRPGPGSRARRSRSSGTMPARLFRNVEFTM